MRCSRAYAEQQGTKGQPVMVRRFRRKTATCGQRRTAFQRLLSNSTALCSVAIMALAAVGKAVPGQAQTWQDRPWEVGRHDLHTGGGSPDWFGWGSAGLQFAQAGADETSFDIPAQVLTSALDAYSEATGISFAYTTSELEGIQSPGVAGRLTAREALTRLLAGTGITYRFTGDSTAVLERGETDLDDGLLEIPTITVEGFRAERQSTATKLTLPLRETPQSISVVTEDVIEAKLATDLGSALEQAAGVARFSGSGPFAGRSPFSGEQFVFRGVQLDDELDLRVDGYGLPGSQNVALDLALFERVEALKGAAGALYGRGSPAGFVNRVTKKPLFLEQPAVAAEATVGSFDLYRAEGDVTGSLGETLGGRLILAYEDAGSFVDYVESDRVVAAPSLVFEQDDTRVLTQLIYQRDRFIPNVGFPLIRDGNRVFAPNIDRSEFVGLPNESRSDAETSALIGRVELEQDIADDWLLNLNLHAARTRSDITQDGYAYGIALNGDSYFYASRNVEDFDGLAGELNLTGEFDLFGHGQQVLVGLEANGQDRQRKFGYVYLGAANVFAGDFSGLPRITPQLDGQLDNEQRNYAAFGQAVLEPFEGFKIILGGRQDWTTTSQKNQVSGEQDSADENKFTGRIGAVYNVTEDVSVYSIYATSFNPVLAQSVDGILPPETGELIEAGLKTDLLSEQVLATLSVFRLDRDNVPIQDPDNRNFSISAGLQRAYGAELEVNGELLPGWNVSFAGSLLDAEYIERRDPNFGTRPEGSSRWQASLFTTYELQSGPLAGLGFGGGVFAVGDRVVDDGSDARLDGYERVDASIFYNGIENVQLTFGVRNVFDQTYVEVANNNPFARSLFGSPRAFLFRANVRF